MMNKLGMDMYTNFFVLVLWNALEYPNRGHANRSNLLDHRRSYKATGRSFPFSAFFSDVVIRRATWLATRVATIVVNR